MGFGETRFRYLTVLTGYLPRRLDGVESTHLETVPVKEVFDGKTIRNGNVEVFALYGHPEARRVYAWADDTDDPKKPRRHITLLHVGPVISAVMAVKAAILQEFKGGESAAEEAPAALLTDFLCRKFGVKRAHRQTSQRPLLGITEVSRMTECSPAGGEHEHPGIRRPWDLKRSLASCAVFQFEASAHRDGGRRFA